MTLEERQLLLIDISARLPYGVYVHFCNTNIDEKLTEISLGETINQIRHNGRGNHGVIKPYLRPMSSMAKEEFDEYMQFIKHSWEGIDKEEDDYYIKVKDRDVYTDWLLEHHLDYRGLIPMGLAIEAPDDMYNKH